MLIPFGILSAAGAGGAAVGAFDLIETQTVGTATSSVVFTSLDTYASDYKHLQIRIVGRSTRTEVNSGIAVRFNGDTGTNYVLHGLVGSGSSATSFASTGRTNTMGLPMPANNATASAFGAGVVDILDAYSTTKNKTVRALGGIASNFNEIALNSGLWLNTASLTSMTFIDTTGNNIAVNTRISIYGIKGD